MASKQVTTSKVPRHWTLAERITHYSTAPNKRGCILWGAYCDQDGYGTLKMRGKMLKVHRAVWELRHGPIPSGLSVLHECDTPGCINVTHLRVGTTAENMADRERRGRGLKGEKHPQAKLTAERVAAIRLDTRAHRIIAAEYGISQSNVSMIKTGRRWAENGVVFRDRQRVA
jgi:hypothetical protein